MMRIPAWLRKRLSALFHDVGAHIVALLLVGLLGLIGGLLIPSPPVTRAAVQDAALVFLLIIVVAAQVITWRHFRQILNVLREHFAAEWQYDQYKERERHFPIEKRQLAEVAVVRTIPRLIQDIRKSLPNGQIDLVLDSGTTLTPLFPNLFLYGIGGAAKPFHIYTNNIDGMLKIHGLEKTWSVCFRGRQFYATRGRSAE